VNEGEKDSNGTESREREREVRPRSEGLRARP
jgi:hypothetical protein